MNTTGASVQQLLADLLANFLTEIENIMKTTYLSAAILSLTTLASAQANAQNAPQGLSSEQVRAELVEAARQGDLIVNPSTGETARDLAPHLYPASQQAGLTREQVRAELVAAERNGGLIVDPSSGRTVADNNPAVIKTTSVQGKTRGEVVAELAAAERNGELVGNLLTGQKQNEIHPQFYPQQS